MSDATVNPAVPDDQELLDLLLAEEGVESGPRLVARPAGAPLVLSHAQQRLWFLQQLDPASAAYNIVAAVRLDGRLDAAALELGLNDLVARHEVLRIVFPTVEGRVAPQLLAKADARVVAHDFSAFAPTERAAAVAQVQAEITALPFDLAQAPLVRLVLVRLGAAEHVAILVMHHIASDGWSMDVLVRELGAAYFSRALGQVPTWPALPLQYADFATWQRGWLESGVRAAQLDYWRRQLANPPTLALPTDRPRPARPDFSGATLTFTLPATLVEGVRWLARDEDSTMFMVLLAAFQTLLHRYTGQDDLVVGAPVANRTRSELEPLIGFFVNTLVLRADFSGRPDFRTLLRQVKRTALDAYDHQDVPFEDLVQELQPERHLSQNPLFQVMFSVQAASREVLRMQDLSLTPLKAVSATAKFDLTLAMEEGAGGIGGALEYRTALFDAATMRRFVMHFEHLLAEIVSAPAQSLATLRLQSSADEREVVSAWNATARPYPARSMGELFAAQAAQRPAALAVRCGGEQLSYAELDARANSLAHGLIAYGVRPGTRVVVCLERSIDLIVALLGIIKAGGAYVALDPELPATRLALMVAEAGGPVVLTHSRFVERLTMGTVTALCLDRAAAELAAQPVSDPRVPVTLEHLAYVSYTSGSTGVPKGVEIPQRGVVRLVQNTDFATFTPADVFLQLAPVAFDASTLEVWAPLLNGGVLVMMPPGTPEFETLGRTIREERITTLWLTAGLFHLMVDERLADLAGVRQLLAGGDVLSVPHVRKFLQAHPACRLINGYGPTENTTFTCCHTILETDLAAGSVPIGRPIANTRVYVLDPAMRPLPIGVPGELYTGGDGLARGYLDRPELTSEKFVPDPFAGGGAARLYRTGDRVRWLADGTIQFLGRLDHQVKIRGYRIEPGETEAALLAEPGVKAAAVIVRDEAGKKRLIGYAVSPHTGDELRARLQTMLPDYQVPAVIVTLDALPLTANGKLDRAALPAPVATIAEGFVAPRTELERTLSEVWCSVLGLARVGVHDNYFASGGDSISAIQVSSRLKHSGWQIDVRDVFQFPTIADLATRLRRSEEATRESEVISGPVPLTPAQAWFFAQPEAGRHHFNQAVLLSPRESLTTAAVAAVTVQVWRHHDALRTVFAGDLANIQPAEAPAAFDEVAVPDEAARLAHSEKVQSGFDLARGPLFRTVLYRIPTGDRLLLVAHHFVIDGVSWRIVLEDFELGLRQHARGEPVDFGPKSNSILRWTGAAAVRASAEMAATETNYWKEQAAWPVPAWPALCAAAANTFGAARTAEASLPEDLTRTLLTTAHAAYHTETNDLLLTALGRALKRWNGGDATRVTMEGHGRDPETGLPAVERTVGWFTCLYPVVLAVGGDDIGAHVKQVKEALRQVPAKGIGHGLQSWLRAPAARPAWTKAPGAKISFNYLGQFGEESGGRLVFAEESTGTQIGSDVVRVHELDAGAAVVRGRLGLSLLFHPGRHDPTAMERLLADWRSEIATVIAHCAARVEAEKTPADFTSRLFALPAYEAFLAVRNWRAADVDDVCRLSPMQAGLLFQTVFDSGSTAYFVQMAYRLRGRLDVETFAQAWRALGERHAILRTSFVHQGVDEPLQLVWKRRSPEVTVHDVRAMAPAEQARRIAAARSADLVRGFDLERDALWRVVVWQTTADTFQVVWSYHHVLLDGWSLGIVHRDLLQIYETRAAGGRAQLPAAVPYRNYVRWLATRDAAASRKFWADYLDGYEQTASLPRLLPATESAMFAAGEHVVELEPELCAKVRALAARAGVTLNILFQAAWGLVIARHNRANDVVFGTIVSGRPAALLGVEEMVGLFICAVPVRVQAADGREFLAWLRELQSAALAAEAHHHLPMTEIQTLTLLGRDLFDHLLVFENYPMDRALGAGADDGLRVEGIEAHDRTHYDLDVTIDPGESIAIKFGYNQNVYPDAQIARVAGHLRHVLEQAVARPNATVGDFALATPAETRVVIEVFNATTTSWPRERTLVDLLDETAECVPDHVAVVHGDTTLTYRELHARANRLAHALRRRGVGLESIVGLCVERSVAMIVGVLGIMKAGGAYVPLDPLYPADRLAFMVSDAGVRVLVVDRENRLRAGSYNAGAEIFEVDGAEVATASSAPVASGLRPESLAYVIYTSGSTGRPKGVMIEHRTLVNAAVAWRVGYGLDASEVRLLQMASLSFDVFAGDFIRALTNGGTLVVCDAEARGDPAELCDLLTRHRVTLFESTPGLILPLMEHVRTQGVTLPDLRLLILGSDTLAAADYRRLVADFGATMRVVNSYGLTEATIDSSFFEDRHGAAGAGAVTPIGRPLANTRLYVLDARLRPCPIGVAGELFVGGEGLARGYFNRPELTAENFIAAEVGGVRQRLYRTGDLARWMGDGNVEFLGRGDQQVKVRGFRVEPGEIEARLRTHPSVREAIVLARPVNGANELVAYIVADLTGTPAVLRAHVFAELPEHMAPAYWVALERFPLSPNGKIDRRALPAPEADAGVRSAAFVAPRNAVEETLAAIWREVLQVARIGVADDFFELGGHSLKAMQVVSRVQRAFGVRPKLRDFFANATIAGLAALIAGEKGGAGDDATEIPPAPRQEHYELSYAQQRLWLLHRLGGEAAYNMPEAYLLETALDADALEQAFCWLVARHEALRTAFMEIDGEPRQRILAEVPFTLGRIDLTGVADADARAKEIAEREATAPFDLTKPPLLRATIVTLGPRRVVFLLTVHHIIGDGWSGTVLYREVFALYAAARRGASDPLPPLRIHYKDFAVWQKAHVFERDEAHWRHQLAGVPDALALPYDFTPGADRDFRGDSMGVEIDAAVTQGLRRIARANKTTLSNVVLAVFELLLFQITKQEDLCLGISVANRNHPDLENLIGFFVNILPVRTRLNDTMEFDELLAQVVAAADDAFEHQDYPFDLLVQKVNPHRSTNRQPLLNVIYAFQNFSDVHVEVGVPGAVEDGAATAELAPTQAFAQAFKTSKFDLTLFVTDEAGRLQCTLEYDTGLFRPETIRRHLGVLRRFATMVAAMAPAAN